MKLFHTDISSKWNSLTIFEQMANIGAEVGRSINWRNKNNSEISKNAFYRALELVDFTIADKKNMNLLGEICRMREVLVDFFAGDNIYHSKDNDWEKYFYHFNFAARAKKNG